MSQQNCIENLTVVMGAGESRIFMVSGEYFEILEAPDPIDVLLSDINGAQRARLYQASASYFSKGVDFAVIQITSATAQTVRVVYGTGESGTRRTTGSMTISGAVALDAATLLALENVKVDPIDANLRPSSVGALGAGGVSTLMTPAQNPNGAIVLSASILEVNGAAANGASLIAKAGAAPVSLADGEVLMVMGSTWNNGANTGGFVNLPGPRSIPAAYGLYVITNAAMSAVSVRSAVIFTK